MTKKKADNQTSRKQAKKQTERRSDRKIEKKAFNVRIHYAFI